MDTSARAPGYDLFKLVIALMLLLIFICLVFWIPANIPQAETPTPTGPPVSPTMTRLVTSTVPPPTPPHTETSTSNKATMTAPSLPSSTQTSTSSESTSTALPISSPTGTSTANLLTATAVFFPSPTGTDSPTPSSTSIPTATESPIPAPSSTPTAEIPSDTEVCTAATSRSRLQVGMNATILRRLNFRSSPGIQNNWILTNIPGTQVEIIDGPVCLPHFIGAYLWWQIKLPDGRLGWSAEASLLGRFYFIEPRP